MVFHLGLETLGINYTSASSAAMIAGAIPALTAGLAITMLNERLTARRVVGISLAVPGVVAVRGVRAGTPRTRRWETFSCSAAHSRGRTTRS
jgi:drug/metabolite transporter (DMT)-like permease